MREVHLQSLQHLPTGTLLPHTTGSFHVGIDTGIVEPCRIKYRRGTSKKTICCKCNIGITCLWLKFKNGNGMCSKSVRFSKSNTAETQKQLLELFLCFCCLGHSYVPFWNLTKFLEIQDRCFSHRNRCRNNVETELSRANVHLPHPTFGPYIPTRLHPQTQNFSVAMVQLSSVSVQY